MDQMDYIKQQENCGIKIGDTVFIKDSECSGKHGWENNWDEWMDYTVGCEGIVTAIDDWGIQVEVETVPWKSFGFSGTPQYGYPFWVLEKIEPISFGKYNTTCPRCGAPAYQGLILIECSRGC